MEIPENLTSKRDPKSLTWLRKSIDYRRPHSWREAGSRLHDHPGRGNSSGTGLTPKHSLPPMVVWAWLVPSIKVMHLTNTLEWWGPTRYILPVYLASLALRKNSKDGNLDCSSLGGWQKLRHPWPSNSPGESSGTSVLSQKPATRARNPGGRTTPEPNNQTHK